MLSIFPSLPFGNFNSHAHVERDVKPKKRIPEEVDFNSHAHVERDKEADGHI